jgi:hypothetical protein
MTTVDNFFLSGGRARGPATGCGPHRTIYLTGIDANGKVASACSRLRLSD